MSAATRAVSDRPLVDRAHLDRALNDRPSLDRTYAERPRATAPERASAPERACRYCCAALAPAAKKCRSCGEWAVYTSGGLPAAVLRLLAFAWTVLSVVAAGGVWIAGAALRTSLIARAVDPVATPLVLTGLLYAVVAGVLLQGLTVGAGLAALAGCVPRRPRWWS